MRGLSSGWFSARYRRIFLTEIGYSTSEREMRFATVFLVIIVALISAILAYAFFVKLDIAVFLATAISALSYVLFTYWDQYIASPDLQITFDSTKPAEYTPQLLMLSSKDGTSMGNYRFIRAVINNRGSRLAHGCVAKIQLIERPPNCTMFSEEPKMLKWVDIPERNYIPPRGGNAVLGVAFSMERPLRIPGKRCAFQNEPDTVIRTYALTPETFENPSIRAQDAFCIGNFKIRLTVYCEEGNTVSSDYVLEVSEEWQKLNMRPI